MTLYITYPMYTWSPTVAPSGQATTPISAKGEGNLLFGFFTLTNECIPPYNDFNQYGIVFSLLMKVLLFLPEFFRAPLFLGNMELLHIVYMLYFVWYDYYKILVDKNLPKFWSRYVLLLLPLHIIFLWEHWEYTSSEAIVFHLLFFIIGAAIPTITDACATDKEMRKTAIRATVFLEALTFMLFFTILTSIRSNYYLDVEFEQHRWVINEMLINGLSLVVLHSLYAVATLYQTTFYARVHMSIFSYLAFLVVGAVHYFAVHFSWSGWFKGTELVIAVTCLWNNFALMISSVFYQELKKYFPL